MQLLHSTPAGRNSSLIGESHKATRAQAPHSYILLWRAHRQDFGLAPGSRSEEKRFTKWPHSVQFRLLLYHAMSTQVNCLTIAGVHPTFVVDIGSVWCSGLTHSASPVSSVECAGLLALSGPLTLPRGLIGASSPRTKPKAQPGLRKRRLAAALQSDVAISRRSERLTGRLVLEWTCNWARKGLPSP